LALNEFLCRRLHLSELVFLLFLKFGLHDDEIGRELLISVLGIVYLGVKAVFIALEELGYLPDAWLDDLRRLEIGDLPEGFEPLIVLLVINGGHTVAKHGCCIEGHNGCLGLVNQSLDPTLTLLRGLGF
jgi:hypothetical protein